MKELIITISANIYKDLEKRVNAIKKLTKEDKVYCASDYIHDAINEYFLSMEDKTLDIESEDMDKPRKPKVTVEKMPPDVQVVLDEIMEQINTDPAMKGKSIMEIELVVERLLEERGYTGKGWIKIGAGPLYGEYR